MQLDAQCLFSDLQDIGQVAGTYLCTNSYDLGVAEADALGNTILKDLGRGNAPELFVMINEAVTSGGAATVDFQLIQADNEAMTSNLQVLQSTGAIAVATLVSGYQPRLSLPAGITKRYLGIQYVIATATTTAGTVTAGLVALKQTNPKV